MAIVERTRERLRVNPKVPPRPEMLCRGSTGTGTGTATSPGERVGRFTCLCGVVSAVLHVIMPHGVLVRLSADWCESCDENVGTREQRKHHGLQLGRSSRVFTVFTHML